jgi:hypothetical protein
MKIYLTVRFHDIRTKILRQSVWLYFQSFAKIQVKPYPREKQLERKQVQIVAKIRKYLAVFVNIASWRSGATFLSKATVAKYGL